MFPDFTQEKCNGWLFHLQEKLGRQEEKLEGDRAGAGRGGVWWPQSMKDSEETDYSLPRWTKGTEVCAIDEERSLGRGQAGQGEMRWPSL